MIFLSKNYHESQFYYVIKTITSKYIESNMNVYFKKNLKT